MKETDRESPELTIHCGVATHGDCQEDEDAEPTGQDDRTLCHYPEDGQNKKYSCFTVTK